MRMADVSGFAKGVLCGDQVWTQFRLWHRTCLYRVRVTWVPVTMASRYTADRGWSCSLMVGERSNVSSLYPNVLQQILCDGLMIILKRIFKNFFFDSVIVAILFSI
jgi:hypothetical protein